MKKLYITFLNIVAGSTLGWFVIRIGGDLIDVILLISAIILARLADMLYVDENFMKKDN